MPSIEEVFKEFQDKDLLIYIKIDDVKVVEVKIINNIIKTHINFDMSFYKLIQYTLPSSVLFIRLYSIIYLRIVT